MQPVFLLFGNIHSSRNLRRECVNQEGVEHFFNKKSMRIIHKNSDQNLTLYDKLLILTQNE